MAFLDGLSDFKGRAALIDRSFGTVSYDDLLIETSALGRHMPAGSLVLIVANMQAEPVFAYVAGIRAGAAVMFTDIKTKTADVLDIVAGYMPDVAVVPADWDGLDILAGYSDASTFGGYVILRRDEKAAGPVHPDLRLLLPTSGSLGSAKFVRISDQNLSANTASIIQYLRLGPDERAITTMPISYSYMLSIVNTHLACGASIVVCESSIMEKSFWETARETGITSLSGVPYFYQTLNRFGFAKMAIPTLIQMTQAGGKLDDDLAGKVLDFCETEGIRFTMMYGQTEASPRMTYLDPSDARAKIGSIGKAIPGTEVWLEDDSGARITAPDVVGEIVFRGGNVSMGYADGRADLAKGDENGGVLRTGDLAMQDADGFFFIRGRSKRIAKLYGIRFNLDEIESRLLARSFEAACLPYGEKIVLFAEPSVDAEMLLAAACDITEQRKQSFDCRTINAMPRTANGKIDYPALRKGYLDA